MSLPLELPTLQNWSCHNCGGCCKQHAIEITEAERQRILAQNWTPADGIPAKRPLFVRLGGWLKKRYRLGHQPDGACVFLDDRGLCRIHAKFGEPAKPLACRIYPYAFHPAGGKVTVSLRFSCPSVVANQGRRLVEQRSDLRQIEELVVPAGTERIAPPPIAPGEQLDWTDTLRIVQQFDTALAAPDMPLLVRLLRALLLAQLLGQSKFDKVRGARLAEFLQLLQQAVESEISDPLPTPYPEPSAAGRMQFRLLAAQYARKDTFAAGQTGWRRRWQLFRAALQFTRGTGQIPPLQEQFAAVPFANLEAPFGALPPDVDEILTRYFRVKIQGLHFCGRAYYDVPVVEGFQSLALMFPVVLWIARWLAASRNRTTLLTTDIADALAIADHHHGYAPLFGSGNFRRRVRTLAQLDDIARLAAWYTR